MTTQQDRELRAEPVSENEVVQFLRTHPDFFARHTSLLAILEVPHPTGAAVSLIERQVSVLREQNRQLKRKLEELIQVARENDRLQERVHALTLAIMEARSAREALSTVREALTEQFAADAVAIHLFEPVSGQLPKDAVRLIDRGDPALGMFEHFFKGGRPLVGRLKPDQLEFLFGDQASVIQSAALVPLGEHAELGLLAIGSREESRFHPSLDTQVLAHLGRLIQQALKPYYGRAEAESA